jgi:hypothetical protein
LLTLLLVYSLAFIDKESVVEDQQEQTKGVDAPETHQVTKTRGPVGLFLEKQKRVEELSLSDVFMWRNVFVSGILFILTHAIYLLLTRYQFTVITLVGRVIQIQVIIFFLYIVFARIVKNTSGNINLPFTDFTVSKKKLEPYIDSIVDRFNDILRRYIDILMCKNLSKTLHFIIIVQIICLIGKAVDGIHSLYALLNILFIIPIFYEWKKQQIDELAEKAWNKAKELWKNIDEKIPPNVKAKITAFLQKLEGPREETEEKKKTE